MASDIIPESRPIVTLSEAKASGVPKYFTGKPCKRGHLTERAVRDHGCMECARLKIAAYRAKYPLKVRGQFLASVRRRLEESAESARSRAAELGVAHPVMLAFEAKEAGMPTYFSGSPCPHGHIGERRTSNGRCIECALSADDMRERRKERARALWPVNRERLLARARAWKAANRPKLRLAEAKWRAANPDWESRCDPVKRKAGKVRSEARRRAQKLNCEVVATTAEINALLVRQKHKCGWCGTSIKRQRELDHVKPLSLGGAHSIGNLLWSCRTCNRKKRNKDPIVWAQSLGRLI